MLSIRKSPALVAAAAATLSLSVMFAPGAQAASKSKHAAKKKPAAAKTAPAASGTVTACVNKKSGATKILLGAKATKPCPKGTTKVIWSLAGPGGAAGAAGANGKSASALQLRDSAGNVLGAFIGLNPFAPFPLYSVVGADGGFYSYLPNGLLYPGSFVGNAAEVFEDSACTGTAFANLGGGASANLVSLLAGPSRVVFRWGTDPTKLGAARVWKYTTTTVTVPAAVPAFFQLDQATGACVAASSAPAAGDTLDVLANTPAPPDGVGVLSVS